MSANDETGKTEDAAGAVETAKSTEPKAKKLIKARVLVDCEYGKPNEVVELASAVAKAAEANGQISTDDAAVAYALSLVKQDDKA